MHPLLNIAHTAALDAGKMIVRASERLDEVAVTEKSRNDFVSDVDIRAEQMIIEAIHKAYPDHGIIGEESGFSEGKSDTNWIIDPLDGTRNFLRGIPHYAISIAVEIKGRIEHGVVYDPIKQEMFTASRGQGARMNNRRLRVSTTRELERGLLATGFPFRNRDQFDNYMRSFTGIFEHSSGIRRAGAAALDLAYVAAGRLDGYWEMGLNNWDIAAGALLVKEAGGMVADFQGGENYFKYGDIIAANPKVFKSMLQIIHPAFKR